MGSGLKSERSQGSKASKGALTPSSKKWPAYNRKKSAPKHHGNRCSVPTRRQQLQKKPWQQKAGWKPTYKSRQIGLPKSKMRAGQKKATLKLAHDQAQVAAAAASARHTAARSAMVATVPDKDKSSPEDNALSEDN